MADPSLILTAITITTGLISAVGVVAVNIITALQNKKIDTIGNKADVITAHVNRASAASAAKIDALEKQIVSLTAQLSERKEIAALLAQAVVEKK